MLLVDGERFPIFLGKVGLLKDGGYGKRHMF